MKSNARFALSGVTRDAAAAAIPFVEVLLFEAATNLFVDRTRSDAAGNYSFLVPSDSVEYFVVCFIEASPDLAGVTNRNVRGVIST